jgi:hypothetical protein
MAGAHDVTGYIENKQLGSLNDLARKVVIAEIGCELRDLPC